MRVHSLRNAARSAFETRARCWLKVLALLAVSAGLTACSFAALREQLTVSTSDGKEGISMAGERLTELDQATYSYADRFVTLISDACDKAAKDHDSKEARKQALRLKLHNASSVYAVVTGPNPLGQLLDLATLVTLNKIDLVDEGRAAKVFGDRKEIVERAFGAAHDDIWQVAERFLQPNEIASVKRVIKDWRAKHRDVTMLAYVRFDDFARARAGLTQEEPEIGGLFDRIDEVNRTVKSAEQFGERAFYYMQRVPRLLQWQTERTVEGVLDNTDLQKLQGAVQQVADAAQVFAAEVKKFDQRQAGIQKHLDQVSVIVQQIDEFAPNAQAVLQDGQKLFLAAQETSSSLGNTLQVADKITAQFASDTNSEPVDAKPFDINEYTRTAEEVAKAVNEANRLLVAIQSEGLAKRAADLQRLIDDGIDHLAWRAAQLAVLVFLLVLAYRAIPLRSKAA